LTLFVPERSAEFFARKIEAYRDENTKTGKPKNEPLVARIEDVRLAAVRSLFTDEMVLFPPAGHQAWWEVWIRDGRLETFRHVAQRLDVALKNHTISFPERDAVLALADEATMARLVENTDAVAELRLAKDTPTPCLEMRPVEQADWAGDLVDRVDPPNALADNPPPPSGGGTHRTARGEFEAEQALRDGNWTRSRRRGSWTRGGGQRDANPRPALRAHRFGGAEKDCFGSVVPPALRTHRGTDTAWECDTA
jgi:hypothetical protein